MRRQAPRAGILVQTAQRNSHVALEGMRHGADYCFFAQPSTLLEQLPMLIKEMLEKHEPRVNLDLSLDRYHHLTESLAETVYELDAEGRFLSMSYAVKGLLNYDPQESIGLILLLSQGEYTRAEGRFNERRSARRATRALRLSLKAKGNTATRVEVEVTATGLYDRRHGQFKGTIGVLRNAPDRQKAPAPPNDPYT